MIESTAFVLPPALTMNGLRSLQEPATYWLWDGYLAAGNVTLLTSQWKSGKTTLVSVLLARRRRGGALAGRSLAAGKTAVVTEEGPALWAQRERKLDFGPGVCFFCRPFRAKP